MIGIDAPFGEIVGVDDLDPEPPGQGEILDLIGGVVAAGGEDPVARSEVDRPERGGKESLEYLRDGGGRLTLRIFESLKPVIAAVNGAAVGVGVTMQLPMDIRIASENARFGFVFNKRGINPEAASSWFLPRLVGIQQALEWCYTGRVFPASEALSGGLVSRLERKVCRYGHPRPFSPDPSPTRP